MDGLQFRAIRADDIELICRWRVLPHVAEWFGQVTSEADLRASYQRYVDGSAGKQGHLMLLDGRPIGFVESYRIEDQPQYFTNLEVAQPGSVGLDLFIGDPNGLGRGVGTRAIRQFVEEVIFPDDSASCCYVAPDVRNSRSIRAFERAGFLHVKDVQVPGDDGPAAVLEITRALIGKLR